MMIGNDSDIIGGHPYISTGMRLEDEISQKRFRSPEQKLAVNILYSCGWLNAHYARFFKGITITPQQFNVLRILRGQHPEPCSLKVVKERMLDPMSDASRIVDKLVAKKYVDRKTCPGDRRAVHLLITPKGLRLLKRLDFIDEAVIEVFGKLSQKEILSMNRMLDKMRG
jgi:DNA-binding MarR family transcriptional regulator